jgi:hypothetical protein
MKGWPAAIPPPLGWLATRPPPAYGVARRPLPCPLGVRRQARGEGWAVAGFGPMDGLWLVQGDDRG